MVAALSKEAATGRVQAWLAGQAPEDIVVSEWVVAEISSAFALKLRTGDFTQDQRSAALGFFNTMISSSLEVLPVLAPHFRTAARFCDRYDLGLRAADALHLAVSATHGATLTTLDRKMAMAGPPLGLATCLL